MWHGCLVAVAHEIERYNLGFRGSKVDSPHATKHSKDNKDIEIILLSLKHKKESIQSLAIGENVKAKIASQT